MAVPSSVPTMHEPGISVCTWLSTAPHILMAFPPPSPMVTPAGWDREACLATRRTGAVLPAAEAQLSSPQASQERLPPCLGSAPECPPFRPEMCSPIACMPRAAGSRSAVVVMKN